MALVVLCCVIAGCFVLAAVIIAFVDLLCRVDAWAERRKIRRDLTRRREAELKRRLQ